MIKAPLHILIADDDDDDCQMIEDALRESRLINPLKFVADGEELLAELATNPALPGLILLDLNMPKKDGREALAEIKSHPEFKNIPIVILTTSQAEEDIVRTYNLGVNSFITKPVTFAELVRVLNEVTHYWFEVIHRPKTPEIET